MDTIPILQQPKSSMTTNILIPNEQKEENYEIVDKIELEKLNKRKEELQKTSIKYTSFGDIHKRISESVLGIMTEIFDKREDDKWVEHIKNTFTKDQRYAYIGILLIIISIIIIVLRKNLK